MSLDLEDYAPLGCLRNYRAVLKKNQSLSFISSNDYIQILNKFEPGIWYKNKTLQLCNTTCYLNDFVIESTNNSRIIKHKDKMLVNVTLDVQYYIYLGEKYNGDFEANLRLFVLT